MKGIKSAAFGRTREGKEVRAFTLENGAGMQVTVLDYGATIQAIRIPDRNGELRDVCLGYRTVEEYEQNPGYLGATVGRCANRIANAQFELGGKTYQLASNDGKNHLHGGSVGFNKKIFSHAIKGQRLLLSYFSPDGEENYPGNLEFTVSFSLEDDGTLRLSYQAKCDQDTVFNPTNHTYFNLEGEGESDVLGHQLCLHAQQYTPVGEGLIPTGEILPVEGTVLDFRAGKQIGQDIRHESLKMAGGYDHNFVPDGQGMREVGWLFSEKTGIRMTVSTDMPGIQLYTGNGLSERQVSKTGNHYFPYAGLCLETQYFPDAIHQKAFSSPVLPAWQEALYTTCYRFETVMDR